VTSVPPPSGPRPPAPVPLRPELPEGVRRDGSSMPPPEGARRPPAGGELPRWPPWAPFAAMLIALVIAVVGATVIAILAKAAGTDVNVDDPPPGVTIGSTLVQDLALIFAALLIAGATAGRPSPGQFGLRSASPGSAAVRLIAIWVAFLVVSFVWAALLHINKNDDLPQELGAEDSTTALAAVTVLVSVVAPVAEEFFFRGFCFTALRRWLGLIPGAVATGVIFGLIHAGSADAVFLVPLAILGLLLCLLYHWTGSLLPCMVLHSFNNSLALGVSQHWSAVWVILLMAGAAGLVLAIATGVMRAAARPAYA
jgi:uncharacterized protein